VSLRALLSARALLTVWLPILGIASLHYLSPPEAHWVHDVARRLFYVPILLAGTQGGVWGGVAAAVVTILLYSPHAFLGHLGHDPGSHTEKLLEMLFYLVIGAVSGALMQREHARRAEISDKDAQLARAARLESLGQLAAGLAHEIRNPLHAMRGTAEIVLDAVPADAPEADLGQAHLREIDRLNGVLSRFLAFARNKEPAPHGSVDLNDVVRRVSDLIRAQAGRDDVRVELVEDGDGVTGNEEELVQVVLALALNGLQAGPSTMLLCASGSTLRVENDGPPIPEDDREQIFDPFFTTRAEGTGLGLSVAWRLVKDHGGSIALRHERGRVVFEVAL
jgi:two-component system, NtrC family, sensor histidine kinase HydH